MITMRPNRTFPLLLALACLLFFGTAAAEGYGKQKVVYHVNGDDPAQQAAALRNVQNHINAVGAENLDLRVVMHGKGVSMVLYPDSVSETKLSRGNADETMQARIAGLKQQGVDFKICRNTFKGKKIDPANHLYDVSDADIVPSGVAELAKPQGEGFTYIKP
jgi:intracellular sulfur oxidation DsrE/DsrF family protein